MTTKQELKQQIDATFSAWLDEVAEEIQNFPNKSYETIGRQVGTSTNYIYSLARKRGIRREADKAVEVSNA
jgi:hypothetical protein